ncbi:hypothetical protein MHYP_G00300710 [Metynnis hypsauchen]
MHNVSIWFSFAWMLHWCQKWDHSNSEEEETAWQASAVGLAGRWRWGPLDGRQCYGSLDGLMVGGFTETTSTPYTPALKNTRPAEGLDSTLEFHQLYSSSGMNFTADQSAAAFISASY